MLYRYVFFAVKQTHHQWLLVSQNSNLSIYYYYFCKRRLYYNTIWCTRYKVQFVPRTTGFSYRFDVYCGGSQLEDHQLLIIIIITIIYIYIYTKSGPEVYMLSVSFFTRSDTAMLGTYGFKLYNMFMIHSSIYKIMQFTLNALSTVPIYIIIQCRPAGCDFEELYFFLISLVEFEMRNDLRLKLYRHYYLSLSYCVVPNLFNNTQYKYITMCGNSLRPKIRFFNSWMFLGIIPHVFD